MARINTFSVGNPPWFNAPRTHEGAPAKNISAEQQLRRSVLACMLWEDQFYEDGVLISGRIRELVAKVAPEKVAELADSNPMEATGGPNPVELMQRRAEILSQRGADLKKLADAWDPLFKTLTPDQKKRMAFATYAAMHGIPDAIEHHIATEDDDD